METIIDSNTPQTTAAAVVATMAALVPPRIGEHWAGQGGVYVGIMRGRDGQPDHHLVAAIGPNELEDITWGEYGKKIEGCDSYYDGKANTAAMAAVGYDIAKRIQALDIEGNTDWHLPSQAEARLLAANVREAMNQGDYYWTSTQCSAGYAWSQGFGYGTQYIDFKDAALRAVAVRRLML